MLAFLGRWQKVTFAVLCAERILPAYLALADHEGLSSAPFVKALRYCRGCLTARDFSAATVEALRIGCQRALPTDMDDLDELASEWTEPGLDAAEAVVAALRCMADPSACSRPASLGLNMAYQFVIDEEGLNPNTEQAAIWNHTLLVQEVAEQHLLLSWIRATTSQGVGSLLDRSRAGGCSIVRALCATYPPPPAKKKVGPKKKAGPTRKKAGPRKGSTSHSRR